MTAPLILLALIGLGLPPAAQTQAPTPAPVSVERVRGNLYLVKGGSGANAGFYVREKDVVVIDAKMTPESAKDVLAGIAKATPLPVTTVVLTHSDGDHVNGLPGFPRGLAIVAHANVVRDLTEAAAQLPALKDYLPTRTYTGRLDLGGGVVLENDGPAHTDGDTVAWFDAEKAAFIGDLAFTGRDPLVHLRKNGSSAGYAKTLRAIVARTPAAGLFLSGHSDPLEPADLEALASRIEALRERVKGLVAEGKTLDDLKAALNVPPSRFPSLAEVIYTELSGKK